VGHARDHAVQSQRGGGFAGGDDARSRQVGLDERDPPGVPVDGRGAGPVGRDAIAVGIHLQRTEVLEVVDHQYVGAAAGGEGAEVRIEPEVGRRVQRRHPHRVDRVDAALDHRPHDGVHVSSRQVLGEHTVGGEHQPRGRQPALGHRAPESDAVGAQ